MKAFVVFSVILLAEYALGDSLVVDTCNGKVKGRSVKISKSKTEYFAFNCIPYAKPPVGDLRFKAPQPAENWHGVLKTETCAMCPQIDFFSNSLAGDENCLTLNVFTPINTDECDKNEPLPVMVFIHGGEWRSDSGDHYSPSFFMRSKKVILVTFNYRIGPLGFLSTGDEIVPGNNGLKDQSAVLRWIQENIRSFGGNPRKVTIFGSDVGGPSVRYHMLSPMSKGLFVGAIAQGGNELNTWAWHTSTQAVITFRNLARRLNCSSSDVEKSVNCLKQMPFGTIAEIEESAFAEDRNEHALVLFKPVTEVPNENAFLCRNPVEILKAGEGNDVPLILGFTENEGANAYAELFGIFGKSLTRTLTDNLHWLLPKSSASWRTEYGLTEDILCRVRDYYLPKECLDNPEQVQTNLINLISDAWYLQGHNDLIRLHQQSMSASIYQYVLSYKGDMSFANWPKYFGNVGPSHYDEELYLFEADLFFSGDKRSETDRDMIKRLIELWTNFAIYQTPTPTVDKCVDWEPVCSAGYEYLDIIGPNELVMKRNFNYERAEFWRDLAYEFGTDGKCCL